MSGKTICGPVIASAIEKALKMGESNACMKRIVAAPTAGACGVVPAVYLTLQEQRQIDDERMLEAMYIASGVGGVIANRAFLAGAAGGCQAEIGSASSSCRRRHRGNHPCSSYGNEKSAWPCM